MSNLKPLRCLTLNGRHPIRGEARTFRFYAERTIRIYKFRPLHVIANFRNVEPVLAEPLHIYQGLEREGRDECYCYVGRPKRYYMTEENTVPFRDGFCFTVFVTSAFEIVKWRSEPSVSTADTRPEGYEHRFTRCL